MLSQQLSHCQLRAAVSDCYRACVQLTQMLGLDEKPIVESSHPLAANEM